MPTEKQVRRWCRRMYSLCGVGEIIGTNGVRMGFISMEPARAANAMGVLEVALLEVAAGRNLPVLSKPKPVDAPPKAKGKKTQAKASKKGGK